MMHEYKTRGGITIHFENESLSYEGATRPLIEKLDTQRGALFTSSYEYPGRYTCWDIGFYNPPLMLTCKASEVICTALNERGKIVFSFLTSVFKAHKEFEFKLINPLNFSVKVPTPDNFFNEEERSHQPSVFSVLREILKLFRSAEEPYLGLYGAFGYDLIFQFEDIKVHQARLPKQRDMVLYLPDEIHVVDHRKEEAFIRRYDFTFENRTTLDIPRTGDSNPPHVFTENSFTTEFKKGEYADLVEDTKKRFACGDLFEVVLSQTFTLACREKPSEIFQKMGERNPSPYCFFINLGEEEYLVGASPEMYVRVQGKRIETCPISGTIKRGENAIEDASNIQELLSSTKEASELTMCTDVDRNDKSRICEAGSVRVIGRRQIEMYSRVIHTVDHVEGILREGFDAIDAFLTHMWVVTVTGAPKLWAMQHIEKNEKSPRKWYGGAVGWFNFNGNLNTGLVLRTFHIEKGMASIRVGATLLYDSIPQSEEEETRLKASAFLEIVEHDKKSVLKPFTMPQVGVGKRVLIIDHQDSFVHTLANYVRQTGADVITIRYEFAKSYLAENRPDLVLLSPGPGRPTDFNLNETIEGILEKNIPIFGVCLGLQALVEYFGGTLDILAYPMHGKPSQINVINDRGLFSKLGDTFTAGRYHSLYAKRENVPSELEVTAISDDNVVMAISHKKLPIHAVQFHPETILSLPNDAGLKIMRNVINLVKDYA